MGAESAFCLAFYAVVNATVGRPIREMKPSDAIGIGKQMGYNSYEWTKTEWFHKEIISWVWRSMPWLSLKALRCDLDMPKWHYLQLREIRSVQDELVVDVAVNVVHVKGQWRWGDMFDVYRTGEHLHMNGSGSTGGGLAAMLDSSLKNRTLQGQARSLAIKLIKAINGTTKG